MSQNIDAFLRVLDTEDNSTGGGTASSIAGAMAAGLVGMVARLSSGKEGLDRPEHYDKIAEEANRLSRELFDGGKMDSAAFDRVSAAYKMPKDSPEAKAKRSEAIQKAMVNAAEVPLTNAGSCKRILELCSTLERSYNRNAASDLQCARFLAEAGFKGCAANVRINLPAIKNSDIHQDIEDRLNELEREVLS